jgi:hypothetical protein
MLASRERLLVSGKIVILSTVIPSRKPVRDRAALPAQTNDNKDIGGSQPLTAQRRSYACF